MIPSWGMYPRSEWKVSPLRSRMRWRLPRWSIRNACSPSWKRSLTPGLPGSRLGEEQGAGEADERHQRRHPERGGEAEAVGEPAERGHADSARADGEADDEAGGHAGVSRQIRLPEHDGDGEGRHHHEAEHGED